MHTKRASADEQRSVHLSHWHERLSSAVMAGRATSAEGGAAEADSTCCCCSGADMMRCEKVGKVDGVCEGWWPMSVCFSIR